MTPTYVEFLSCGLTCDTFLATDGIHQQTKPSPLCGWWQTCLRRGEKAAQEHEGVSYCRLVQESQQWSVSQLFINGHKPILVQVYTPASAILENEWENATVFESIFHIKSVNPNSPCFPAVPFASIVNLTQSNHQAQGHRPLLPSVDPLLWDWSYHHQHEVRLCVQIRENSSLRPPPSLNGPTQCAVNQSVRGFFTLESTPTSTPVWQVQQCVFSWLSLRSLLSMKTKNSSWNSVNWNLRQNT